MRCAMNAMSLCRRGGVLALVSVLATNPLRAQDYWPDRAEGTVVRVDVLKPFFKENGYQFLSGAVFFSGGGPIGKIVRVVAEVPLVRAGLTAETPVAESSLRLGNPYIGLQIHRDG